MMEPLKDKWMEWMKTPELQGIFSESLQRWLIWQDFVVYHHEDAALMLRAQLREDLGGEEWNR